MYQEKIEAYWSDPARERELVSAISRLVAVKSVKGEAEPGKPFGAGPAAALDEALKLCAELGFTTTDYDHYVGLADLNDKETRLHILGHLDVVGEGSGWSTDPYTCVEKDGMMVAVNGSAHMLEPLFITLLERRPELRQVMQSALDKSFSVVSR